MTDTVTDGGASCALLPQCCGAAYLKQGKTATVPYINLKQGDPFDAMRPIAFLAILFLFTSAPPTGTVAAATFSSASQWITTSNPNSTGLSNAGIAPPLSAHPLHSHNLFLSTLTSSMP